MFPKLDVITFIRTILTSMEETLHIFVSKHVIFVNSIVIVTNTIKTNQMNAFNN